MADVSIPVVVSGKNSGKQYASFAFDEPLDIKIATGAEGVDMYDLHLQVEGDGITIKRSQLSVEPAGAIDFHMFGAEKGDDASTAQAVVELTNLLIPTLIQVTPGWGTALPHAAEATTQAALVANAPAIVAQLKLSPTWPAIVRALASTVPPSVLKGVRGDDQPEVNAKRVFNAAGAVACRNCLDDESALFDSCAQDTVFCAEVMKQLEKDAQ